MNLETMKATAKMVVGRKTLVLKKHSPAILMTAGIVGMVTTVVLSSRSTLKLEGVMDEHDAKLLEVKSFRADVASMDTNDEVIVSGRKVTYTEEDYKRDLVILHARTASKLIKLYALPAAVGAASIAMIVTGHTVLDRRNVATMAAYAALEAGFDKYRARVRDEYGAEKDQEFARPKQVVVQHTDAETGETTERFRVNPDDLSVHAQWFDNTNKHWTGRPDYDLVFLRSQQNFMNDRLHAYGHVFLNEVYDALGMERTSVGSVVGWILPKDRSKDIFVDFGIFPADDQKQVVDYVNGEMSGILLDFNVTGIIWDKIGK